MGPMQRLYVGSGSYECPGGEGSGQISIFDFDVVTGTLDLVDTLNAGCLLSFVSFDRDAMRLYVGDEAGGRLRAFAIDDATGRLTALNDVDAMGNPVYVVKSPGSAHVLAAHFNQGRAVSFSLEDDGSLGPVVDVEEIGASARSHAVVFAPGGDFVFVPNRDANCISQFVFDRQAGTLGANPTAATLPLRGGPRHMEFHPTEPWAYVVHELSGELTAVRFDPETGTLDVIETVQVFTDSPWAADVHVHPNGHYVYASDRTSNAIEVFAVDPTTGALTSIERVDTGGRTPRNFTLDATGRWLFASNHESEDLAIFAVDPDSGRLDRQDLLSLGVSGFVVGVLTFA